MILQIGIPTLSEFRRHADWPMRVIVIVLVLFSVVVHGASASLVLSALSRLVAEESAELSPVEVELREITQRFSRVRFTLPLDAIGVIRLGNCRWDSQLASRPCRDKACTPHLLGAGIALRC